MGFHEIVALHKMAFQQLANYWPVAVFLVLGEIFLLMKSKQFTRRGGIEAVLSTAIPFLILVWGLSAAPESATASAEAATLVVSIWTVLILVAGGVAIRATILQVFFHTRTVWEFIACLPLPAFVYFTGYVALK